MHTVRHFIQELKFGLRQLRLHIACAISKHNACDPRSPLAPVYDWAEATINRMMDEDNARHRAEALTHIGYEYDWAVTEQRQAAMLEDAELIDRMSDKSFQLWLSQEFPELSSDMRAEVLARFRAGTL